MNYDPNNFGVTFLAAGRSKTKDQKLVMLAETEGKCWVDYHHPGVCPQKGRKLTVNTVIAAHIVAHSKGGDDCVGMCEHCNAEQGVLPLDEYEIALLYRQLSGDQKIAFKQQLKDLQKSNKKTA
jgi:hypothetical protein